VTAKVGALPDVVRGQGKQRVVERASEFRAAAVALSMSAYPDLGSAFQDGLRVVSGAGWLQKAKVE
jgi:hypothetical protein